MISIVDAVLKKEFSIFFKNKVQIRYRAAAKIKYKNISSVLKKFFFKEFATKKEVTIYCTINCTNIPKHIPRSPYL